LSIFPSVHFSLVCVRSPIGLLDLCSLPFFFFSFPTQGKPHLPRVFLLSPEKSVPFALFPPLADAKPVPSPLRVVFSGRQTALPPGGAASFLPHWPSPPGKLFFSCAGGFPFFFLGRLRFSSPFVPRTPFSPSLSPPPFRRRPL